MATLTARVEAVKDALNGGTASESTVTVLQDLLKLGTSPTANEPKGRQALPNNFHSTKANGGRNGKRAAGKANSAQTATIHEDGAAPLSARAKYALATETVNASLKTLTDLLKSTAKATTNLSSPNGPNSNRTPTRSREESVISRRALAPRSSNATPVVPSPDKQKLIDRSPLHAPDLATKGTALNIVTTAECARIAFSFLRSVDPQKIGVRDLPRLQLETGMVSLVSKMIAHGLESMAIKELRLLKRRLEASFPAQKSTKTAKAPSSTHEAPVEKETLASLMHLHVSFESNAEALAVAISYYLHVLKIISASRKPAVIQEVAQYLQIETPNSMVDLIVRHAQLGPDTSRGVKQLESLAQTILALCPSVATASDDMSTDPKHSPNPQAVLGLQTLALRVRRLWWSMAEHETDMAKELIEPFTRCATTFLRRHSHAKHVAYDSVARAFESLGPLHTVTDRSSLFNIHYLLGSQAQAADMLGPAQQWLEQMVRDCESLETNHARRVVCDIRRDTILIRYSLSQSKPSDMDNISNLLQNKLTGTCADYDLLISTLTQLSQVLERSEAKLDSTSVIRLAGLAAGFGLRYSRSYPGKNTQLIQSILDTALRLNKSVDDMLLWVTEDAANFFVQNGTLRNIAHCAETKPLLVAWMVSTDAVALSRVLRALLVRTIRNSETGSALVFDDQNLEAAERGILLELQLKYATELTLKPKYHDALRKVLPDIFGRLSKAYPAAMFPIRRARVSTIAFRLRESDPDLLPPHDFQTWHKTTLDERSDLSKDARLQAFFDDVKAGLAIGRVFSDGQPVFDDFKISLQAWERLVDGSRDKNQLCDSIADPPSLIRLLDSMATYLTMLGEDAASLATQILRVKLMRLFDDLDSAIGPALINLAGQYLRLGYAEQAGTVFSQAQSFLESLETPDLLRLQYRVVYAEYLLATDNVDHCRENLEAARVLRSDLPCTKVSRDERTAYELVHAHAWLVQSRCLVKIGSPHDALAAAKRSIRVLNSIWSNLERLNSRHKFAPELDTTEPTGLGQNDHRRGVSKLQLTPIDSDQATKASERSKIGSSFWCVFPLLCNALLHVSDLYAHHGLFNESNCYSERAVHIAASIGPSMLLSRLRSHRSQLLTLADQTPEAELCLAHENMLPANEPCHASVERYCAQAALREKEGSPNVAAELYQKAESVIKELATSDFLVKLQRFDKDGLDLERGMAAMSLSNDASVVTRPSDQSFRAEAGISKAPGKKVRRGGTRKTAQDPKPVTKAKSSWAGNNGIFHLLQNLGTNIMLRKILARARSEENIQLPLEEVTHMPLSTTSAHLRRRAQYCEFMHRAFTTLGMDVTLNVLAESTLSFPALSDAECENPIQSAKCLSVSKRVKTPVAMVQSKKKPMQENVTGEDRFVGLLNAARDSLLEGHHTSVSLCGTVQTYVECSMLLNASLLLSATSGFKATKGVHPLVDTLPIDLPRVKALEYEQQACAVNETQTDKSELLMWPTQNKDPISPQPQTAAAFQELFIDILPKSWTTVSLSVSEDFNELYVARYDAGQTPLLLRLPFSRHKPDGLDEEAFDYRKGKAELRDIIERSNYTCHNPGSLDMKGAKTKWWNEREALDRRMHELLINIENIWLGGFKGVFSGHPRHLDLLANFRKSFEATLQSYLPSRKATKGRTHNATLHDQVLQLFIGLGDDQDGTVDLDEPLSDLLYFVVDMLQFHGERNAYDEIDFDSMAVEVIDALRSYHNDCANHGSEHRHLILVLDKRLQSFPWESLPYLHGASVSRVGSLLSLRERVLAQRSSSAAGSFDDGDDHHSVSRASGTYILNPSSDLPGTQNMLEPVLHKLRSGKDSSWTAIVNSEPDETSFTSALQESSMLLYFGHGAGSQYIRPRTIKRLSHCCDVVWLMGCSSGAVYEYGELEPCAVPLAYLLAGHGQQTEAAPGTNNCKAVVATLWDVTDKDVDRFSLALGEEWGLWPPSEQSKLPTRTPKKREVIAAPSTPQQFPQTPKTPRVTKTPAPLKTPARNRPQPCREKGQKTSLVEAVSRSRDACYLRYLNGAAPVVYGVPVYLGD